MPAASGAGLVSIDAFSETCFWSILLNTVAWRKSFPCLEFYLKQETRTAGGSMHLCPLSPLPKTDDKMPAHLSVLWADFPTPSPCLRTPSLQIKSRLKTLTELPEVEFNMILRFMAGPGAPGESCLSGTQCPGGITAIPGSVKETQLVRRQHVTTASPI